MDGIYVGSNPILTTKNKKVMKNKKLRVENIFDNPTRIVKNNIIVGLTLEDTQYFVTGKGKNKKVFRFRLN